MSGHSHARTIKHQKNITDQKRGQMFSKMARVISVAVKQGGPNPEINARLRLALEEAKGFNMPKDNIERAIKKATGEGAEEKLEEVSFEAIGPGGTAVIVEGITDNKKRTLGELKQILNQNGSKLAGEGAIRWMFERKGCVTINLKSQFLISKTREEIELLVIEAGAEDIRWHDESLDIHTKPEELENVRKALEEKGIKIESASSDWVPKEELAADEKTRESCQKLFDALDENEDIQEIYSNIKR